jgi:flagellar hook-length control protein FliK
VHQAPQSTLSRVSGAERRPSLAPAAEALVASKGARAKARVGGAPAAPAARSDFAHVAAGTARGPAPRSFASILERAASTGNEPVQAKIVLAQSKDGAKRDATMSASPVQGKRAPVVRAGSTGRHDGMPESAPTAPGADAAASGAAAAGLAQAAKPAETALLRAPRSGADARDSGSRVAPAARQASGGAAAAAPAASPRIVLVDLRPVETQAARAAGTKGAVRRARQDEAQAVAGEDRGQAARVVAFPRQADRHGDTSPAPVAVRQAGDSFASPRQAARRDAAQASSGQSFSQVLRDEVVRHATVVVRDAGQGEIRLLLKPESLGEVRIRMKVVDDRIEGRIVVQNAAARDLFQDNLGSLEAALREQGFLNARLDVALSDGGGDRGQSRGPAQAPPPMVAAEELERTGRVVLLSDAGMHAVDMVV